MSDIASLTEYVESHRDDYEQRWRLVKKLYTAGEYSLSVDHLEILRDEWDPQINVVRYLAATYYRLDRHSESIETLTAAVRVWPSEIGLREQLAQVLEVANRREEALKTWEKILELDPKHDRARQILERLKKDFGKPGKITFPSLDDVDFGIDLMPGGIACPSCETQNSAKSSRCWKCNALLPVEETEEPEVSEKPAVDMADWAFWQPAGIVGTFVLLLAGIYLTVRDLPFISGVEPNEVVIKTVTQLLSTELLVTHVAMGALLLVVWCVGLWAILLFWGRNFISAFSIALTGAFSASLAYVISFGPFYLIVVGFAAGVAVTGLVVLFGFKDGFKPWFFHTLLMIATGVLSFLALEGKDALLQFPMVSLYAYAHDTTPAPGCYPLKTLLPTDAFKFHCESTGSTWLDQKAPKIFIELQFHGPSPELTVEVKQMDRTIYYKHVQQTTPFVFDCKVVPGSPCTLSITGENSPKVDVTAYGVMKVALDN